MNKTLATILTIIVILVTIAGIVFATTAGNLAMKKFFGPKFKEVERDIWEESPSRVLGATQEIAKSMVEWNRAEDIVEKNAICAYLRNSYPDLTPEKINDNTLRTFFENCKYGR